MNLFWLEFLVFGVNRLTKLFNIIYLISVTSS